MAEGRSNAGIAECLVVSESAVAKHINSIFTKLDLSPAEGDHRRVLAVLRFLEGAAPPSGADLIVCRGVSARLRERGASLGTAPASSESAARLAG
jgi:hypothetical protein